MTTIPDHVGREAVRLLNEEGAATYRWPRARDMQEVITVAKLLMNPPAPMTDPDEEAAKRVLKAWEDWEDRDVPVWDPFKKKLTRATEQMRKERKSWEAGR